ncbi:uncharacterized protein LOC111691741 [Anoplophora glabripennis]|uniref:uncharacterized protein LOC111691741 n=1 Tax=Anoplophora glabripennis TaxID=217634 RepID=UPI000A131378|nr:uncharacterized protein LOC111691741 [Anoplophora glabripennis]
MLPEETAPNRLLKTPHNLEKTLHHALLMTEVGMDLKERYISGEKYVCYLKSIITGADKAITALHYISKSSLEEAKQLIKSLGGPDVPTNIRNEYEKLLAIIDKQLNDLEMKNLEQSIENLDITQISDKIRYLELKQKNLENSFFPPPTTASNKSIKADIDEKYPENLSRESLIDLNNVVNLPPVPEDIFTSFSSKPTRTSSLSSLKSMRKIKLYLQKAESSDDEDSSENEESEYHKLVFGDSDESKSSSLLSPLSKKHLGNIKEEAQD